MNLDEIAPGRAAVAIGLGTEKSTEIIRNAVKTVKNVINGKEINFYGRNVNVRKLKIGWPPIRRIPVYAAVNGPKSCEAVADVADGIHFALMPVGYVDHIIKMLKKIRGDLKGFEFLNHIVTFISEDYDDAEKRARGYVRPHALHIPLVLEKAGFKEEEIEVLRRWPAGKTEEIINNLMTLSTKVPKGIPENVIEKLMAEFSIYGTPDDVVKRLKEYEQKGLDMMSITLFGPDITRDIKLIAEKVFPEFE
jgi:alkanesulfonate monooxygenase SsuD/methylene tetrahydromethanopterin reductase-like flavin-dependent oxidoreductase (luciferase family)